MGIFFIRNEELKIMGFRIGYFNIKILIFYDEEFYFCNFLCFVGLLGIVFCILFCVIYVLKLLLLCTVIIKVELEY